MDSRYLLIIMKNNYIYYIDLFKINLLRDILIKKDNNTIKEILFNYFNAEIQYINSIDNILYINEIPKLEILINFNSNLFDNINEHIINNDKHTTSHMMTTTDFYTTPNINDRKYLLCIKDKIKYYIKLNDKNSNIRKILHKKIYCNIGELDIAKLNNLINEISISSPNSNFSKFELGDDIPNISELLYKNCETYKQNLELFIEYLNEYNNYNDEDYKLNLIDNNNIISLKFIKKLFFDDHDRNIERFNPEFGVLIHTTYLDKYQRKYLQDFILFNKYYWDYEIVGDNKITKDIFFNNIFDISNTFNLFKVEHTIVTLTLKKNIIIKINNIIYNIINKQLNYEINIKLESINIYIKQIFYNNIQEYCYFTIIGNDKYRIKFTNIEKEIKEAYDKNLELTFKFFNDLIRNKYGWINNDLRFINLHIVVKDIDTYFYNTLSNYRDISLNIGGNKYNKYTLKELKQIAKKNKIKITKMVVISNDELHKKLKDKNIIINKKIKLEDFKRILMENNIKITKRVNLNKQELIKKLIN